MGYKQRNKKTGSNMDMKGINQRITNHSKHNPQMKKLNDARKFVEIQKMLGRPMRKFNLLYSLDDGDWFSSEDDLKEGLIKSVLSRLSRENPVNCSAWSQMYQLKSKKTKDDKQFFMYANLSNDRTISKSIDKFTYFTWEEQINI